MKVLELYCAAFEPQRSAQRATEIHRRSSLQKSCIAKPEDRVLDIVKVDKGNGPHVVELQALALVESPV